MKPQDLLDRLAAGYEYDPMYGALCNERDQLKAENIKLRVLALALADCRNTTCDDCVRWDYSEGGCSLDDVMHELGLKVSKIL